MGKMNRLIRGELNKILMRPILYVITGILVVALVFSMSIYNPEIRNDTQYAVSGTTNSEAYSSFNSHEGSMNKSIADEKLDTANSMITYYENLKDTNTYTSKLSIVSALDNSIDSIMSRYSQSIYNTPSVTSCNNNRNELVKKLKDLRSIFVDAIEETNISVLVRTDNIQRINDLIQKALTRLDNPDKYDYTNIEVHKEIWNYIDRNGIFKNLITYINEIKDVQISDDVLSDLRSNIITTQSNLNERNLQIKANYVKSDYSLTKLKDDIRSYYLCADQLLTFVMTTIKYEPIKSYNDSTSHQFKSYEDVYSYELKETITRCSYLIDTNTVSTDYAMMYNAVITSNGEKNAFDFMYYGIELCGAIIILFCVVLGAGMVAGEQTNGTLKLLTIRPFSRNKIISSKIIATLIFGAIFAIFSAIILFIMGYIFYGVDMTNVLGIFNASIPFVLNPILVMLIYILFLIFKIFIYTLIAVAISVLFRSNVGAVGISIFIYFFSALFGVLFLQSYWYAYLPFSNFDLFKYLGGAFANTTSNPLAIAFSSGIFYNTNFWFSAVISIVFAIILLVLTYSVFKKREIK